MRWVFSIARASLLGSLLFLIGGCISAEHYHLPIRVTAVTESAPVPSLDDAADDPAIWINKREPSNSLVIGTDKGSGLLVYDLQGEQRQYLPEGQLNNVDLRQQPWRMPELSVLVATERNPSRLNVFELDHFSGQVTHVAEHTTEILEPYGICMWLDEAQRPFVIANGKDGLFVQYALDKAYNLTVVRRWQTKTQPEGCVADDRRNLIYLGEEEYGIWVMDARPSQPPDLELFASIDATPLVADVEGLALIDVEDETWLLASSQGDNSFAVFNTQTKQHLFSFHVSGDERIDGVSETDGIAITNYPLPGFPMGLLVVQDDDNRRPGNTLKQAQNFKWVSWQDVLEAKSR